ncbi:MAG: translocation/assembly module TamB domain-containing protein, partial [Pseudomonadota bacterium]
AEFDLSAGDIVTALAQSYDLPPIDATVAGVVDGVKADVSASLSAGPGAEARLSGAIPLAPETEGLDLSVVLERLPMALANRILGNPGLVGTLTGSAQVRGAIADPRAAFDLAVREVTADVLRQNGVAPLSASARGGYARDVLRVDRVEARNSQGLEATGSGTVPLVGTGLSLRLNGQAPLQLANLALADRATQLSGRARANLSVTGRLSDPQPSGEITISGATVVDPGTNLRLEQVGLVARIEGDRVILTNGRANLIQGGRASLEGEISLDAARNFPLDLALGLRRARYSDGDSLSTILGGEITLSGAALGDLLVGGEIELEQTEIVVPDGFGLAAGEVLSVSHRNAPQGVTMTLDRAGLRDPKPAAPAQRIGINLRITAPNRMFVRGRGLDTELGGTLVLTGSLDDLVPVGGFEMRRGRFNVIGQRISFSEGAVTLRGTLD